MREFYFSRNGVRRRILSVQYNNQISFAVEVPQDPYRSAEYFSKSNQKDLCQRLNLGLSFSKLQTEPFICSDLEGPQVARVDTKLLFALTKIAEVPEAPLASLYKLRCQELADFHRQQWNSMDTIHLVKRLKLYPQLEKRLRYFATMESKALLSIAAKYRIKNN